MNIYYDISLWIILNVAVAQTLDMALFLQNLEPLKSASIFVKILVGEFWASIEWIFLIAAQRIGYTFLTASQLVLSSYVFDFMSQIWSNAMWLNNTTTIDDYVGMAVLLFGASISVFKLLD